MSTLATGAVEPTHYPYPMSRFGTNPFGKPLWRIVFADSVHRLAWSADRGYVSVKAYHGPNARGKWVLESWQSAQEFCGCTQDEYNLKMEGVEGREPWPFEGVYVERHVFDAGIEGENIPELIAKWHHDRASFTFADRRRLRQEAIDYEQKSTTSRNIDMLVDAQPNPNGSMMIKKRRQINLRPAKDFKLPKAGLSQVKG